MAGVVTCMARCVVTEKRRRTPVCAESMACARPGETGAPPPPWPKLGRCRPTRRFSRSSTASACSPLRGSDALRVISRVSSPTPPWPVRTKPPLTVGSKPEPAAAL